MHILIVEDHPPFRRMLATLLAQEGFVVDTAPTAEEAGRKLAAHRFSVVVADYNLLDGNRADWLRQLREHARHTKIILVSGLDDADLDPAEVGWIAHRFRKPLNLKGFLAVVKRLVAAQET